MYLTILVNRGDMRRAIDEEKANWIRDVLSYLGLDPGEFENDSRPDLVAMYLDEHDIDIVDYIEMDAVKVEQRGELVGEWLGPAKVTLREDEEDESLYYEVILEFWSIIDEEESV